MMHSKFVKTIMVVDPDSSLPVELEIRKLETGAMVGLDGAVLEHMGPKDEVYSPYDYGSHKMVVPLILPDDEVCQGKDTPLQLFGSDIACYEARTTSHVPIALVVTTDMHGITVQLPNDQYVTIDVGTPGQISVLLGSDPGSDPAETIVRPVLESEKDGEDENKE